MAHRVLLVEDDELLGSSLLRALRAGGHDAVWAQTIAEATAQAAAVPPHLALVDVGLPDGDGLDLVRDLLQSAPLLPVIVLTARAEEADVVVGLHAGAVDYITKPFRLAELLARVSAHLRLAGARDVPPEAQRVGDLRLDTAAHRLWVGEQEVLLRPKEYALLARLMVDAGRLVTREQLLTDVWDEHWFGSGKTLDVHMAGLRRKLGERPGELSRITAVRGVGYRLELP